MITSEVPASIVRVKNDSQLTVLFLSGAIVWPKIAQMSTAHAFYNLGSFTWLCDPTIPLPQAFLSLVVEDACFWVAFK